MFTLTEEGAVRFSPASLSHCHPDRSGGIVAGLKHGHGRWKHLATSAGVITNGVRDLLLVLSPAYPDPVGTRSGRVRISAIFPHFIRTSTKPARSKELRLHLISLNVLESNLSAVRP
jgi:hypothetical protein